MADGNAGTGGGTPGGAGSLAAAAQGISAPSQGNVALDLATLVGSMAEGRRQEQERRRKAAMEEAMLALQGRQVEQADRQLEQTDRQLDQAEEDSLRAHDRALKGFEAQLEAAEIAAAPQHAMVEENRANRERLERTREEREAGIRSTLTSVYDVDPESIQNSTLEDLEELQKQLGHQREISMQVGGTSRISPIFEAMGFAHQAASSSATAAEAELARIQGMVTAAVNSVSKEQLTAIAGPDGDPEVILTQLQDPQMRMQILSENRDLLTALTGNPNAMQELEDAQKAAQAARQRAMDIEARMTSIAISMTDQIMGQPGPAANVNPGQVADSFISLAGSYPARALALVPQLQNTVNPETGQPFDLNKLLLETHGFDLQHLADQVGQAAGEVQAATDRVNAAGVPIRDVPAHLDPHAYEAPAPAPVPSALGARTTEIIESVRVRMQGGVNLPGTDGGPRPQSATQVATKGIQEIVSSSAPAAQLVASALAIGREANLSLQQMLDAIREADVPGADPRHKRNRRATLANILEDRYMPRTR